MRRSRAPSRAPETSFRLNSSHSRASSLISSGVAGRRVETREDDPTLTEPDRGEGRSFLAACTVLAVLSALVGLERSTGACLLGLGGSRHQALGWLRSSGLEQACRLTWCTAASWPRSRGRASPGRPDVRSSFEQVRGERVSQGVRRPPAGPKGLGPDRPTSRRMSRGPIGRPLSVHEQSSSSRRAEDARTTSQPAPALARVAERHSRAPCRPCRPTITRRVRDRTRVAYVRAGDLAHPQPPTRTSARGSPGPAAPPPSRRRSRPRYTTGASTRAAASGARRTTGRRLHDLRAGRGARRDLARRPPVRTPGTVEGVDRADAPPTDRARAAHSPGW